MARTSPEARSRSGSRPDERRRWPLVLGALAAGLGMGLAVTGALVPGAALAVAGCGLYGVTWLVLRKTVKGAEPARPPQAMDAETGLVCPPHLQELLHREVARSQRYGNRLALVVFDASTIGGAPGDEAGGRPSPARYIASVLSESARGSDFVARIDETRFMVMLTDTDEAGAAQFAERTRTKLGTVPFAHGADQSGIYVRAWAGWVRWDASLSTPDAFIDAATEQLEQTRPGYAGQRPPWHHHNRAA